MQAMKDRSDRMMKAMLLSKPEYITQSDFTLKRLPLWGQQVSEHEINFEWPTQEMFDEFENIENASLKTLELKDHGCYLASVRVTL